MSDTLHLNCWVPSEDPDRIFSVAIPRSANVSLLARAIKNQEAPMLDHIPIMMLDVWKVNIAPDKLTSEAADFEGRNEFRLFPLIPLDKLFDVVPADEHVRIIVRPQVYNINCSILGDPHHVIFPVTIENTKSVSTLKQVIQGEISHLISKTDARFLDLWRVSLPLNDRPRLEDELACFPRDNKLSNPFSTLFNAFDVFPRAEHLHIVVGLPQ